MAGGVHPLAPEHLPVFVAGPDGGAVVFTATAVGVLVVAVIRGHLDFRPHAPPEMTAHRANRARYQRIAILAPLALFTRNDLFGVAALLLAASKLADLATHRPERKRRPLAASTARDGERKSGRAPR